MVLSPPLFCELLRFHSLRVQSMEPVTSRGSVGWNTTDDTTSKWLVREESIYLSIDTNYITAIIFYFC